MKWIIPSLLLLLPFAPIPSAQPEVTNSGRQQSLSELPADSIFFIEDQLSLKEILHKYFDGKMLLVDCWATWCKPCMEEFPSYATRRQYLKEHDIETLFISFDKERTADNWRPTAVYQKLYGYHLLVNKDIEREILSMASRANGDMLLPTYLLIDTDGEVISANFERPSSDYFEQELERVVKRAAKRKAKKKSG